MSIFQIKKDKRFIILLLILGVFLLLILSAYYTGHYQYILKSVFCIQGNSVPFLDLRLVVGEIEKLHEQITQSNASFWSTHQMICSYPSTWYVFYFMGLRSGMEEVIGVIFIILFYILTLAFIGKSNLKRSVYYGVILCSTPVILALERANVDVFIYLIFILILTLSAKKGIVKYVSYLLIYGMALLKIYPAFALTLSFKENKKIFFLIFVLTIILSLTVYLTGVINPLQITGTVLKPVDIASFGSHLLPEFIHQYLHPSLNLGTAHIVFQLIGFIILIVSYFKTSTSQFPAEENNTLSSFRIGASIYTGCFLFSYNFLYRLIFVILTIPQIIQWSKDVSFFGKLSGAALLLIVLCFTYLSLFGHFISSGYLFLLKELIFWLLFCYYSLSLMKTIPTWLRIGWKKA